MIRSRPVHRKLALLAAALLIATSSANANPLGARVVGGQASVAGQGTNTVTITQGSNSAIINWNTFNIGAGELTQFNQPSATSIALNRVMGNLGPSQIDGHLTANGRVFLVNPYGLLFGSGAKVNVAGLLATTNDIRNEDFMAGHYNFNISGRPGASTVNLGSIHITPSSTGFAVLVAPGVRNGGVITANLGQIGLASGNGFTLDFYGDKLITLQLGDEIAHQVIDVATGKPLTSLVSNAGVLKANGGQVALTAVAARTVVDSVINNTGVIEANSIGTKNGMIVLGAATAAGKGAGAPVQAVKVSGMLSAKGKKPGTKGGTVRITGEQISLERARVEVSGSAGGGSVRIGGKGVDSSTMVTIDNTSVIDASAKANGDGGNVLVWSNGATSVTGSILATGGALGGNGGTVETAGQTVNFNGVAVNASAPNGASGVWLIDPTILIVDRDDAATIARNLRYTNVTLQTMENRASGPGDHEEGPGDIIVDSAITWSSSRTLTLDAYHDIDINAPITASAGGLTLDAGRNIAIGHSVSVGTFTLDAQQNIRATASINVGTFTLEGGFWNQLGSSLPAFSANDFRLQNGTFLRALEGDGSTMPYQITDVYGLQGIGSPSGALLGKKFVIANDIDASGTANWNNKAGFVPIEEGDSGFRGTFDGLGHTISGLTIAPTNSRVAKIGLFGANYGTIANVTLTDVTVKANPNANGPTQYVGTLVGENFGMISNATVTGSIDGGSKSGVIAGGLVGQNGGATLGHDESDRGGQTFGPGVIDHASADVAVTVGSGSVAGGLAGDNAGQISNSSASGDVMDKGIGVTLGGLVGSNDGTITSSQASGTVTVGDLGVAGGLVGANAGSIDGSWASGNVTSNGIGVTLGGLVGINELNNGTITNSHASGDVNASAASNPSDCSSSSPCTQNMVGGLVGWNQGTISSSWVSGPDGQRPTVHVGSQGLAGGLVGRNEASAQISGSHSTANVTGDAGLPSAQNVFDRVTVLGGLVGLNLGSIDGSSATGAVGSPGVDFLEAGGLVAKNRGSISNSQASGDVAVGNFSAGGGLVGENNPGQNCGNACGDAKITNSNATGTVTVGDFGVAGGLVGANAGSIDGSWASGNVTSNGIGVTLGGLVGINELNNGTITNSHASGEVIASAASNPSDCSSSSPCTQNMVGGLVGWNQGTISSSWVSGPDGQRPTVHVGSQGLAGGLVGRNEASAQISGSHSTANVTGDAGLPSAQNVFDRVTVLGGLVGLNLGSIDGSSATGAVGSPGVDFLEAGGLVAKNRGSISNSQASGDVAVGNFSAGGGLVGENNPAQNCGNACGDAKITNSNATGTVTVGDLGIAGGLVGVNAGSIDGSWASGNVTSNGIGVTLGGLVGINELNNGTITNSHASGDVIASAASNPSDCSSSSPCTQNMVGGLVGWNQGTISSSWVSGPDGQRPTVHVGSQGLAGGLVGRNEASAQISGSHSTANVTGDAGLPSAQNVFDRVTVLGGLVGLNLGSIDGSSATGAVGSPDVDFLEAGGLVAKNRGSISNSQASGDVAVGNFSAGGGLVGENNPGQNCGNACGDAKITNSNATGTVTVGDFGVAGGLVGANAGSIDGSWASGNVTSNGIGVTLGGLVGINELNNGTITNSHASGEVIASAASNPSDCSSSSPCTQNMVGGLVGWNQGTISSSWVSGPDGQRPTVHVGSQGLAGGLVGRNEASAQISGSHSTANVTGDAGLPSAQNVFDRVTVLGGLVGLNLGSIDGSSATGAVGSPGVDFLEAGGLVAKNRGSISNSQASGDVAVGNFSAGGGLVGENNPGQNCGNACGDAKITNSSATGDVTVGSDSLAAGLVAINNGTLSDTQAGTATSKVTGGDNSILGGLVGLNSLNGMITNSTVLGSLASTGQNTSIGGFVGVNGGNIDNSQTATAVGATSSSYVGGFVGINIGTIVDSQVIDPASVTVAGSGNLVGGFVGMNIGAIDPSTTGVTPQAAPGTSNIVGGFAGANFNFANASFNGLTLPAPTFPTGTISTSSTTTDSVHPFIGTDIVTSGPSTPPPPAPPAIVNQCSDPLCAIVAVLPLTPAPPQQLPPENPPPQLNPLQNPPTQQNPLQNPQPDDNSLLSTPPSALNLIVPPGSIFTNNGQPVLINLTTGGTGGTGGNGGNHNGGNGRFNNRSPGPPPGPGLGRTEDERRFSGVPPLGETRFRADEIVVQIVDTVTAAQIQALAHQFGITLISSEHIPNGRLIYRFGFASGTDIRRLILTLEHNKTIASVEPNYVFGLAQSVPTPKPQDQAPPPNGTMPPADDAAPDLANSGTASLETLPAGDSAQYVIDKLHLAAVHRIASGRNVTVAVVDSEIDVDHPDLKGVIMERYDATQSESHPHVHGTGMAGAIAARFRLLGVAPGVRILAIKAFDEQASSVEATSYQILKGLDYAIVKNVRIINMSFAGPRDPMMERTLKTAHDDGIILVAAAGNAGPKSPPLYPGADPSVIAVTATDYTDKPFVMANRGKYIAVAAPGVDIMVPAPGNTYQLTTGTSVAAAHVSGVAALLVERRPTITPDALRSLLVHTARTMNVRGKDELDGAGLVDPMAALSQLVPPKTSEQPPRLSPSAASLH